ncbi:MAG: hypothetical protein M3Y44_00160 [Actinomycetota bacterium]|nr:hypothetical protein [Actinomycetota bacterium]
MTNPDISEADSPIEAYLDDLVAGLSAVAPRELRHLLAETEAHLRDDAERATAAGMTAWQAEAQAVARFGPVRDVIVPTRARLALPIHELARRVLTTALLLGGIGAVAVGVSGLISAVIRLVGGARALVDVPAGQALSASACSRWLAGDPGAHSCREAALSDWAAETVGYRIALGVLGLLVLLAIRTLRRRGSSPNRWATLPPVVSDTIAVTAFGAAGCGTLGLGVDAVVGASGRGSGQWFSAAAVALVAAAVYAARLVRALREESVRQRI